MRKAYKVLTYESERGWGQRDHEYYYFSTETKAKDYVAKYNAPNNLSYVPDTYWVAIYEGQVSIPEEKDIIS